MSDGWTDFVAETEERITELNNELLALEREPNDEEAMRRVFRIAHTLKGNCGAAGFEAASDVAHAIEDLLDAARAGRLELTSDVMDVVFDAVDELETMVREVETGGEIETDPTETIQHVRDVLERETRAGATSVERPTPQEIDRVLSSVSPPDDGSHRGFLVRFAVVEEDAGDPSNGSLVVDALIDAFDLLGTDPGQNAIAEGTYGGRFDAVFAGSVDETSIAAALTDVDEIADFEIVDVTDRLEDTADDARASADALEADDAEELEVDELLDEVDEFDDLDEKVKEVEDDDDLDVFDEMGEAGSFDDLFEEADVEPEVEPGEPDDADADESTAETEAEEEVDDASAVFEELKDEVDPVGFDELQDELDELEFDEYGEEEVGMEDLLADVDEPLDDGSDVADGTEDALESEADESVTAAAEDEPLEGEAGDESVDDGDAVAVGSAVEETDSPADDAAVDAETGAAAESESDARSKTDDAAAVDPAESDAEDETDSAEESGTVVDWSESADAADAAPDAAPTADEPPADQTPSDDASVEADAASAPEGTEDGPTPAEADSDDSVESDDATSTDDADVAAAASEGEPTDTEAETDRDDAFTESTGGDRSHEDAFGDESDGFAVEDTFDADSVSFESDLESAEDEFVDAEPSPLDESSFDPTDYAGDETVDDAFAVDDDVEEAWADPGPADDSFGADAPEEPFDDDDADFETEDAFESDTLESDAGDSFEDAFDDGSFDATDDTLSGDADRESTEETGFESVDDSGLEPADDADLGQSGVESTDLEAGAETDDVEVDESEPVDADVAGVTDALDDTLDSIDFDPDADDSFEDTFGADAFDDRDESTGFDDADASSAAADEPTTVIEEPVLEIPDITVPEPEDDVDEEEDEADSQSVRVDLQQVDELLNLVEGLVTTRVRLRHAVETDLDRAELEDEVDELDELVTELQGTVMDVRLVPLDSVTSRLPRVVRDVARDQGKQVDLELSGTDVEIDRTILDRLRDPLIHLIRNAVDHGIEAPEERAEAEKPETGQLEVRATRNRDLVTITVSDDGRGLDPDALRSEAVDADVLSEDEAAALSDEEAVDLVFHSGLSTADEVTDVSGRGVGMDVVQRTVEALDGSISIDSEVGEGTTVTLTVPVSIAIDDVLFLESGGREFGVPTDAVQDVEPAERIETVDGEPVLQVGGESCPVIDLGDALETADTVVDGDESMVVRIRDDVRPVALRCDRVRGQQEVVVKPYEGFMADIPGLSGATVRGRGEVVNILDVTTL
ncbi:chemotaxis protein CheA [Halopiger goleimassiliensis]|uniref:chemotaxis protein CheA n=1 Tax=Halopiger goleimassiliensis TaxID=1293048 RepID=UPI00067793FE|nr:chemotaxis protein CheA [Halopiger goleimassiliensis]